MLPNNFGDELSIFGGWYVSGAGGYVSSPNPHPPALLFSGILLNPVGAIAPSLTANGIGDIEAHLDQ
jgi:hypothetical protein